MNALPLSAQLRGPVRAVVSGDRVFCNRQGVGLTRDGVAYLLRKYMTLAARKSPALHRRRIAPHVLHHSCAVALLPAGVDITVIRDYLGHASIATTNRYVATNLQMKRDALEQFWRRSGLSGPCEFARIGLSSCTR
jgi:integrase/recombinase XerD